MLIKKNKNLDLFLAIIFGIFCVIFSAGAGVMESVFLIVSLSISGMVFFFASILFGINWIKDESLRREEKRAEIRRVDAETKTITEISVRANALSKLTPDQTRILWAEMLEEKFGDIQASVNTLMGINLDEENDDVQKSYAISPTKKKEKEEMIKMIQDAIERNGYMRAKRDMNSSQQLIYDKLLEGVGSDIITPSISNKPAYVKDIDVALARIREMENE